MNDHALHTLLHSLDEAVLLIDQRGVCCAVGLRWLEFFGVSSTGWIELTAHEVLEQLTASCEDADALRALDISPQSLLVQDCPVDVQLPMARSVQFKRAPILQDGCAFGFALIARDWTRERSALRRAEQLQKRIERLNFLDALTQLPNGKRFTEELHREHVRAQRVKQCYAILCIDVDHFSEINDEIGLHRADDLLEWIADRLQLTCRDYDVLARVGSDEFALLLPNVDDVSLSNIAERLRVTLEKEPFDALNNRFLTVCIGGAFWNGRMQLSADEVMSTAQNRLRDAKNIGPSSMLLPTQEELLPSFLGAEHE